MERATAIKIPRLFLARIPLLPLPLTACRISVLHMRAEQRCSSEIMLKIDYVADCIERRINLMEITATIWMEAYNLTAPI